MYRFAARFEVSPIYSESQSWFARGDVCRGVKERQNEVKEQVSRLRSYIVTQSYQTAPLRRCRDAIEVNSLFGDAIVHVLARLLIAALRQTPRRRCAVVARWLASIYHGGGYNRPMQSI